MSGLKHIQRRKSSPWTSSSNGGEDGLSTIRGSEGERMNRCRAISHALTPIFLHLMDTSKECSLHSTENGQIAWSLSKVFPRRRRRWWRRTIKWWGSWKFYPVLLISSINRTIRCNNFRSSRAIQQQPSMETEQSIERMTCLFSSIRVNMIHRRLSRYENDVADVFEKSVEAFDERCFHWECAHRRKCNSMWKEEEVMCWNWNRPSLVEEKSLPGRM